MLEFLIPTFLFFLLIAGLFSGSEVAFFSINRTTIHQLKRNKNKKNKIKIEWIFKNFQQKDKVLAMILFGNLLANIIISQLGNTILLQFSIFANYNLTFSIIILTFILLIFSETIPKLIAMRNVQLWLFKCKFIINIFFSLFQVILLPLLKLTSVISGKIPQKNYEYKKEDLLKSIEVANFYQLIKPNEKILLERTIALEYDSAFSCLIPKSELLMLLDNSSFLTLKKLFKQKKEELAIIFNQESGKILGYITLLICLRSIYQKEKNLKQKIQPLALLPESTSLANTLNFLIQNNISVVGLIGEDGDFSGILKLKQVLNKMLGDKHYLDNHSKKLIIEKERKRFLVDASLHIDNFNTFFNVNLKSEDVETIGGYLLQKLDGFPSKSTTLQVQNLFFYNIKISSYKIDQVMVRKKNV